MTTLFNFDGLPIEFWIAFSLLLVACILGLRNFHKGWGIPLAGVSATIIAWYIGDALYNDYSNNHARIFHSTVLTRAWWQVSLFTGALIIFAPILCFQFNRKSRSRGSQIAEAVKFGHKSNAFKLIELQIPAFRKVIISLFLILLVIAALRIQGGITGYLFPWISGKVDPWARGRIGTGLDAFWALFAYLQLLIASGFGLVTVFAKGTTSRAIGLIGIFLTWPYFLLDRTRNTMLATVMPGLLSWVFIKYRGSLLSKLGVLTGAFLVTSIWFAFVLSARDEGSISKMITEDGLGIVSERQDERHLGLNMYEELCYINAFLLNGRLVRNNGKRYFAELVNPVPRALWPEKPTIGLDYAYARGFAWENAEDNQGGVAATISTGMIGQGVVNFGFFLGPIAAAFLISCWIAFLAHLDFTADRVGRLPLYALGLVATFNLGRDITLLTLYPILFGYFCILFYTKVLGGQKETAETRGLVQER